MLAPSGLKQRLPALPCPPWTGGARGPRGLPGNPWEVPPPPGFQVPLPLPLPRPGVGCSARHGRVAPLLIATPPHLCSLHGLPHGPVGLGLRLVRHAEQRLHPAGPARSHTNAEGRHGWLEEQHLAAFAWHVVCACAMHAAHCIAVAWAFHLATLPTPKHTNTHKQDEQETYTAWHVLQCMLACSGHPV